MSWLFISFFGWSCIVIGRVLTQHDHLGAWIIAGIYIGVVAAYVENKTN